MNKMKDRQTTDTPILNDFRMGPPRTINSAKSVYLFLGIDIENTKPGAAATGPKCQDATA